MLLTDDKKEVLWQHYLHPFLHQMQRPFLTLLYREVL